MKQCLEIFHFFLMNSNRGNPTKGIDHLIKINMYTFKFQEDSFVWFKHERNRLLFRDVRDFKSHAFL